MNIRAKILTILIATMVVLDAVILVLSLGLIMGSYSRLEQTYMRQNAERVVAALDDRLEKLGYSLHDWASWTDTYDYLAGRRPEYIDDNLMDSALVSLNINLVAFFDIKGTLVYEKAVSGVTGAQTAVPAGFGSALSPLLPSILAAGVPAARTGLLVLPDSILLVAVRPVLTSTEEGPATGVMVMAALLGDEELKRLGDMTRLSLALHRIDEPSQPHELQSALAGFSGGNEVVIRVINAREIGGYARVRDIFGMPAFVIGIRGTRDIHANGMLTIWYFMATTVVLSFVIGLTVWILLERIVIRRLERMGADASEIRRRGDMSRHVSVSGNDELANVSRALNAMLDALRQNQARLEQAQRYEAQGKLAGGTAHEFNNILAIMMGSMELVMDAMPEHEPERARLAQAYRAGERGRDIVRQILEFSRGSTRDQTRLSLTNLAHAALELVRVLVPENVTVVSSIVEDAGLILANPTQIEQVIINLFKNAIEAIGDRPGTITFSVERIRHDQGLDHFPELPPGAYVRLSVSDSGIGILPSDLGQIFDPFFTTKKVGSGTGLGLSVVHGIVQQHHGYIRVGSERGSGTTFELLLPGIADAGLDEAPQRGDDSRPGVRSVLVVGDALPPAGLHGAALEAIGYHVQRAADADQALRLCSDAGLQCVVALVDADMDLKAALRLCRKIHSLDSSIGLCLCAGVGTPVDAGSLYDAGIGTVLQKPLTIRTLIDSIEQACGRIGEAPQ